MDPNAALKIIIESLQGETDDSQHAYEALDALCDWLRSDGFVPKVSRDDLLILLNAASHRL